MVFRSSKAPAFCRLTKVPHYCSAPLNMMTVMTARLHFWCLHWSLAGAPWQSYAVVVRELWATGYTPVDADGLKMLGESQNLMEKIVVSRQLCKGYPQLFDFLTQERPYQKIYMILNGSEYAMILIQFIYVYNYTLIDAYVLSQSNGELTMVSPEMISEGNHPGTFIIWPDDVISIHLRMLGPFCLGNVKKPLQ